MRMRDLSIDGYIQIVAYEITVFYVHDIEVRVVIRGNALNLFPGFDRSFPAVGVKGSFYQSVGFGIGISDSIGRTCTCKSTEIKQVPQDHRIILTPAW